MAATKEALTTNRLKELAGKIDFFLPGQQTYDFALWIRDAELATHRAVYAIAYPSHVFEVFEAWNKATDRGERNFIHSDVKDTAMFNDSVMALARLSRSGEFPHPLIGLDQKINLVVTREPRGLMKVNFGYPDDEIAKKYRPLLEKFVV